MAALFVIQGRNKGARFDLAGQPLAVTIGRESGNFIQLKDHEVSRRRAEIRRVGETLVLGDLKSSNGTFVNDRKVERAELASGDRIRIGRTVLVYAKDPPHPRPGGRHQWRGLRSSRAKACAGCGSI